MSRTKAKLGLPPCDECRSSQYTPRHPFVEVRIRSGAHMSLLRAGHIDCVSVSEITQMPEMHNDEFGLWGVARPEQWLDWLEVEGVKIGTTYCV